MSLNDVEFVEYDRSLEPDVKHETMKTWPCRRTYEVGHFGLRPKYFGENLSMTLPSFRPKKFAIIGQRYRLKTRLRAAVKTLRLLAYGIMVLREL